MLIPPLPDNPTEVIARSDRGFVRMPELLTTYGSGVQVFESSAAEHQHLWVCISEPLDRARCEEAYRRLRREATHTPTIAVFLTAYRGLLGTVDAKPAGEWDCTECCDSGWVTCWDHPRHRGHWDGREHMRPVAHSRQQVPVMDADGNPTEALRWVIAPDPAECACNIVRPCSCASGKRAGESWRGHRSVS